ncbi:MAG: A/G-specific adenine glycosylase [Bacteroidales bacterium]
MPFAQLLLTWYDQYKRALPWRETKDAYTIWVSEVILQQTRVEQGMKYFFRFMEAFPDVQALAQAPLQQLLHVWQGLGYYSRARNMHQAAREIAHQQQGRMPQTYQEWLKVKGVGPYTAAAIASIVTSQPVAALDGNAYRVISRIFAIEHGFESSAEKKAFFVLATGLMDQSRPGDFNQALMDFGSLICKPAAPRCEECPFNRECRALLHDAVMKYPVRKKKNPPRTRYFNYFLFIDSHHQIFWVQKRQNDDIWKDLYELPLVETPAEADSGQIMLSAQWAAAFSQPERFCFLGDPVRLTHKLTHQTIQASFFFVEIFSAKKLNFGKHLVEVTYKDFGQMPKSRLMQRFFDSPRVSKLLNNAV